VLISKVKGEMKRLFFYIFVMLVCTGSASAEPAREIPKIWVASVLHNYGEVLKGEEINHAFIIKNQGKADLVIEKAQPD